LLSHPLVSAMMLILLKAVKSAQSVSSKMFISHQKQ